MAIYNSAEESFSPQSLIPSTPVEGSAQPNVFDTTSISNADSIEEENYQNMSDFADIMPASLTPTVEDTERVLLERLRDCLLYTSDAADE